MGKNNCPEGRKWDHLVNSCVPFARKTKPNSDPPRELALTAVDHLKATPTTAKPESMVVLSPALWIFVVLAILGSIFALTVWFIIYTRETRGRSTSEDGMPARERLQKTEPPAKFHPLPSERNDHAEMFQRVTEAPSPCSHVHPGRETGSKWEEGFSVCRDLVMHAGTEGGGGPSACSTMAEHRIPLPATELGGTALVTTKTM